jgi:hypothetical protein
MTHCNQSQKVKTMVLKSILIKGQNPKEQSSQTSKLYCSSLLLLGQQTSIFNENNQLPSCSGYFNPSIYWVLGYEDLEMVKTRYETEQFLFLPATKLPIEPIMFLGCLTLKMKVLLTFKTSEPLTRQNITPQNTLISSTTIVRTLNLM